LTEVSTEQPKFVQNSQKQIPTTRYSRQSGESVEEAMVAVLSANDGAPVVSRMVAMPARKRREHFMAASSGALL
jgi:hypothetical protein